MVKDEDLSYHSSSVPKKNEEIFLQQGELKMVMDFAVCNMMMVIDDQIISTLQLCMAMSLSNPVESAASSRVATNIRKKVGVRIRSSLVKVAAF